MINNQIKDFLIHNFRISSNITNDTSLFKSGLIDSFGVLELIVFLENNFGVSIDTMTHNIAQFDTIASVENLVTLLKENK